MEPGPLVAQILAGSWRLVPPPPGFTCEDLDAVAPLLHRSGAAGCAWWRVRDSPLAETPVGAGLHQAFRLRTLESALDRQAIARAFDLLRARGIEPILGKGWAAARLYSDDGLRPCGDIDLYVSPADFTGAAALLPELAHAECNVDLHRGVPQLSDRPWDAAFERSELVPLEGTEVRVMGLEDHLRLLALHFLGHGAWRPLWLCDLAVALESRRPSFDWAHFKAGSARRTDWSLAALALAHDLMGARSDGVPSSRGQVPAWLPAAVMEQWGRIGTVVPHGRRHPIHTYLCRPRGVLQALRSRWPNPVEATVTLGVPINHLPRWPIQVAAGLWRTLRFSAGALALFFRSRRASQP